MRLPRLLFISSVILVLTCGIVAFLLSTDITSATARRHAVMRDTASSTWHALILSDIHFSPFDACPTSGRCPFIQTLRNAPATQWALLLRAHGVHGLQSLYSDTNMALFESTLQTAQKVAQKTHADTLFIAGDLLGHNIYSYVYAQASGDKTIDGYQNFVRKMLTFITLEIRAYFPNTPIYFAIGNNDSYQGDYDVNTHGLFLQDALKLWLPLLHDRNAQQAFKRTFLDGGYYAFTLPTHPDVRLIVLNSVIFSDHAAGANLKRAAYDQLTFLNEQLRNTHNTATATHPQQALIMMHIPTRLDWVIASRWPVLHLYAFWKSAYLAQYEAILAPFARDILAVMSGHLHFYESYTQSLNDSTYPNATTPVLFVPSISPIFGNNPEFLACTFALHLTPQCTHYRYTLTEHPGNLVYNFFFNPTHHVDKHALNPNPQWYEVDALGRVLQAVNGR